MQPLIKLPIPIGIAPPPPPLETLNWQWVEKGVYSSETCEIYICEMSISETKYIVQHLLSDMQKKRELGRRMDRLLHEVLSSVLKKKIVLFHLFLNNYDIVADDNE